MIDMISSRLFTDRQFPSLHIGMVCTISKRLFDKSIPIISEGAPTVQRINLRLGGLQKKKQDVIYRKDQRLGEALGGRLMEN